jgi:hypothetical protein
VKHLSSRWAALTLLAPVLAILGLLMMSGGRPEAAPVPRQKGTVEVALTTTNVVTSAGTAPALSFQRILLNVISVRLNPSTDPKVSDFDPKWQTIPVPAGVGASSGVGTVQTGANFGGNFGPNGSVINLGEGRSEIQVDMYALQNNPQIFNSFLIPAQTYHVIELVLDPANPGNVVPLCGQGSPRGEGCIVYPVSLASVPAGSPNTVRASIPSGFDVVRKQTQPLVVNIDLVVGPGPVFSGDSIVLAPAIDVIPNSSPQTPLATVKGTIPNPGNQEVVTAELTGTNQIVATASVQTTNSMGSFVMYLPPGNYDFYASGSAVGFVALSNIAVPPGPGITPLVFPKPERHSQVTLSGVLQDACTGTGIPAGTLELFVPDSLSKPAPVCAMALTTGVVTPGCVVVATANTDETGRYPLPGNGVLQAQFAAIPSLATGGTYTLLATASGYNGQFAEVTEKAGLKCVGSGFTMDACSFNLERGEIDTTVDLGAPNTTNSPINVLIMAEDHGTNKIEGVALGSVPVGAQKSAPVTVFVPDSQATPPVTNPVAFYDLFAATQDLFAGQPTKNNVGPQATSGHTIAVTAGPGGTGVAGPDKCTKTPATVLSLSCVGHASIAGTLSRVADENTQVVLSKADPSAAQVQIMTTRVAPMGVANSSIFNFCAPADPAPYTITDEESPPDAAPSVVGTFSTTLATPSPIATPCPSICKQTAGICLVCTATVPNVSLP